MNTKLILYKTLCLIALLVGMNYLYKYFFFEKDLQKHSELINNVREGIAGNPEIIYIGESSNTTSRADDIDKRSIAAFIGDYFPTMKVGSITKEASHAGIYYAMLKCIPENSSVKTVIVTLNLRSFDASWIYSDLETPLQKSIVLLQDYPPLINRLLLSFKAYDVKTKEEREKQFKEKWAHDILDIPGSLLKYKNVSEWDQGMATEGIRNINGSINYPLTELACHYIKGYAFQIDTLTNPRIKDFDKIVALAKKRNWRLVLNLMAENVAMTDSLVGKDLVYLLKQNTDLLIKRYQKDNVYVVNNLDKVGTEEFIDQNWTTEHYAQNGRRIIAENVAACLKTFYPKEYVKFDFKKIPKPSSFFNDCEGKTIWGQMKTLSTEQVFSGKQSSKVGHGQDYSITYEYPIRNLPDSLNKIDIDFKLFQTSIDVESKLVIEVSGKNIAFEWNDVMLNKLSTSTNKWSDIHYSFNLSNTFYKGDLIKIYVFNSNKSPCYIDDLKVNFLQ